MRKQNSVVPPILLIIFKREQETLRVFESIRQAKPRKLYIASDGPRSDVEGETELVVKCRNVKNLIDWPCEVLTLFKDDNQGSPVAIPQAIDWFFTHEEFGIILEDDCLPTKSFYPFCAELLELYKFNSEIWCINGSNINYKSENLVDSYTFCSYPITWGWACWRDIWLKHNESIFDYTRKDAISILALERKSTMVKMYWTTMFTWATRFPNWDYRFGYSIMRNGGMTCTPHTNLVSNIGFGGPYAAHTRNPDDSRGFIPTSEINFPLNHPASISLNNNLDEYLDKFLYKINFIFIMKMKLFTFFPSTMEKIRSVLKLLH